MKAAFVGSRDWPTPHSVEHEVRMLALEHGDDLVIVSGGARGVDTMAQEEAEAIGVETLIFKPDWKRYGRSAGFRRNHDIIDNADLVYAFQKDGSRGTQHSIDLARKQGKKVIVKRYTTGKGHH